MYTNTTFLLHKAFLCLHFYWEICQVFTLFSLLHSFLLPVTVYKAKKHKMCITRAGLSKVYVIQRVRLRQIQFWLSNSPRIKPRNHTYEVKRLKSMLQVFSKFIPGDLTRVYNNILKVSCDLGKHYLTRQQQPDQFLLLRLQKQWLNFSAGKVVPIGESFNRGQVHTSTSLNFKNFSKFMENKQVAHWKENYSLTQTMYYNIGNPFFTYISWTSTGRQNQLNWNTWPGRTFTL